MTLIVISNRKTSLSAHCLASLPVASRPDLPASRRRTPQPQPWTNSMERMTSYRGARGAQSSRVAKQSFQHFSIRVIAEGHAVSAGQRRMKSAPESNWHHAYTASSSRSQRAASTTRDVTGVSITGSGMPVGCRNACSAFAQSSATVRSCVAATNSLVIFVRL